MRLGIIVCLLFMLTGAVAAQVKFPGDACVVGWQRAGQISQFTADGLYDHIDGGAELFLEFGFNNVQVQKYKSGSDEIAIEVYEMQSDEAALGIYLTCCGKETSVAGIESRHSGSRYQFTILHGRYLVLINNFQGNSALLPVMVKFAQQILTTLPTAPCKPLLSVLPQQDLIAGSERLLCGPVALQNIFTLGHGDVLQLAGKIFAASANYRGDQGEIHTLIVAPYPDPQQAKAAYRHLLANLDSYLHVLSQDDQRFVFMDYQQKFGLVEQQAKLLKIKLHLGHEPEPLQK